MNRIDTRLFHLSNALVIGTGVVYAWMAYFCTSDDPYAIVGHPWQPHVQHAHVLLAPALAIMLGLLWGRHIAPHLQGDSRKGRRSGLALVLVALPMIFSGYALQTAMDPLWRKIWVGVHLATSLLWVVSYLIHIGRKLITSR